MTDYIVPSEALEWLEEDSDTWFTEYEGARIEISNPEDYKNKSDLTFVDAEDAHVKLIEIVRCKDCEKVYECLIAGKNVKPDDFCSRGERSKDA